MAAVERLFAYCRVFHCKYFGASYRSTQLRCLSIVPQMSDNSDSHSAYLSIISIQRMKTRNNSNMHSKSKSPDPEFVSKTVTVSGEMADLKSLRDVIRLVKDKTPVLVKALLSDDRVAGDRDNRQKWSVCIGGTRNDVQKAVVYTQSLLNQQAETQRRLQILQKDESTQDDQEKEEKPIWAYYRRNFKGQKPPMRTRKRCFRGHGESQSVSGNPCAICRLYLAGGYVLDYKDIDLLSQFISPHTGEVFDASKTGLCREQQKNLVKATQMAKDLGFLPYSIPGPRSIQKPCEIAKIPRNVRLK